MLPAVVTFVALAVGLSVAGDGNDPRASADRPALDVEGGTTTPAPNTTAPMPPSNSSCKMPNTEADARELAASLGLSLGSDEYPFAGDYSEVGLFAYGETPYLGYALWGTGGSQEERQTPLEWPKYRPSCQSATLSPTISSPTAVPSTISPTNVGATFSPTRHPSESLCCATIVVSAVTDYPYANDVGTFDLMVDAVVPDDTAGHPVYRNGNGEYLRYWPASKRWGITAESYTSDNAVVTSISKNDACPTFVTAWEALDDDNRMTMEYDVTVQCQTHAPSTHGPTSTGITFAPTVAPTSFPSGLVQLRAAQCCDTVVVSGTDDFTVNLHALHGLLMGTFEQVTGVYVPEDRFGHPIYRNRYGFQLYRWPGDGNWLISLDYRVDSSRALMHGVSGNASGSWCPHLASWRVYKNGTWTSKCNITVRCLTESPTTQGPTVTGASFSPTTSPVAKLPANCGYGNGDCDSTTAFCCSTGVLQIVPARSVFLDDTTLIDMATNVLSIIGASAFANLAALSTINLSENLLTRIHPTGFAGLSALRLIQLRANFLTAIPPKLFWDSTRLQVLDLRENRVSSLGAFLVRSIDIPEGVTLSMQSILRFIPQYSLNMMDNPLQGCAVNSNANGRGNIYCATDCTPGHGQVRIHPIGLAESDSGDNASNTYLRDVIRWECRPFQTVTHVPPACSAALHQINQTLHNRVNNTFFVDDPVLIPGLIGGNCSREALFKNVANNRPSQITFSLRFDDPAGENIECCDVVKVAGDGSVQPTRMGAA